MTQAASSGTTASINLMLKNSSLGITSEGTCIRHPTAVLSAKGKDGGISSCESCEQEQKHDDSEVSTEDEARRGQGLKEPNFRIPLSKIVTESPDTPATEPSSGDSLSPTDTKRRIYTDGSSDSIHSTSTKMNQHDNNSSVEDGALDALIARWFEIQGSTPSQDTLSTTLILMQLQKLDRRMLHQERSLESLQQNMQEQQSTMRTDLAQILSCVTAGGSAASPAASTPHGEANNRLPKSSNSGSSKRSKRAERTGKTLDSHFMEQSMKEKELQRIREQSMQFSGVFNSVRTLERQPPKPPLRHDSRRTLDRLESTSQLSSAASTMQESIVSAGARLQNAAPSLPPRSHNGASATNNVKPTPSLPPRTNTLDSSDTISSSNLKPSPSPGIIPKPKIGAATINGATITAKSNRRRTTGPHPLKPKSSFRSLPGPQLDIIWDASEHPSEHTVPEIASGNNTPSSGSRANRVPADNKDIFGGNGVLPKLASSLDDGGDEGSINEDEELDEITEPLAIFSGMQNYIQNQKNAGAALHDSIMTSAFASFGGDSSVSDAETHHSDEEDDHVHALGIHHDEEHDDAHALGIHHEDIQEEEDQDDDDDDDDDDLTESDDGNPEYPLLGADDKKAKKAMKKQRKKEKKMMKKEKKREKKEMKKEKKMMKKEEKERKKGKKTDNSSDFSVTSSNGKTSSNGQSLGTAKLASPPPSDEKPKIKGALSAAKNIIWKRSKHRDKSPPRTIATTTETPLSSTDTSQDIQQRPVNASQDIQVEPIHVDINFVSGEAAAAKNDDDDNNTTKTPMSAKTPYSAIVSSAPDPEPPPPPHHQANRQEQLRRLQRRSTAKTGHANKIVAEPPSSPPPRRRPEFPRTQKMMPKLISSKRDILINGESERMKISTLTLDTALPSADAGSVLLEVTNQSLIDKCKERGSYTGTISESDEPDGYGTMIYNNGAFYKGQWKDGHW